MSQAKMGAQVMYCGHDGWFIADIWKIGNVNVVHANGPIDPSKLKRGRNEEATHRVVDFPLAGFWRPQRGILVVPEAQVVDLRTARTDDSLQDKLREALDVLFTGRVAKPGGKA